MYKSHGHRTQCARFLVADQQNSKPKIHTRRNHHHVLQSFGICFNFKDHYHTVLVAIFQSSRQVVAAFIVSVPCWTAMARNNRKINLRNCLYLGLNVSVVATGPGRIEMMENRSSLGPLKEETSISLLIDLKLFPFAKDKTVDNGSMAIGVNLEVPGESGVGYGEEWPLKIVLSPISIINRWISLVSRRRKWPKPWERGSRYYYYIV